MPVPLERLNQFCSRGKKPVPFPLTPALSPRERENRFPVFDETTTGQLLEGSPNG